MALHNQQHIDFRQLQHSLIGPDALPRAAAFQLTFPRGNHPHLTDMMAGAQRGERLSFAATPFRRGALAGHFTTHPKP
ncbi:hypothetical protein ROS1_05680 [Roseibium sp. ROS1]